MPGDQDHIEYWEPKLPMVTIEEKVVAKIRDRREKGVAKYGVTMERTDLTRLDWLNHAQQEAMDFVIYLEKLISDEQVSN